MTPPGRLAEACERIADVAEGLAPLPGALRADITDIRALATALRNAHHADPDIHGKRTSYVVNLGET